MGVPRGEPCNGGPAAVGREGGGRGDENLPPFSLTRAALTHGPEPSECPIPRCRRDGDGVQAPGHSRRAAGAAGLRNVPGPEAAPAAQLERTTGRPRFDRCRRPESRPYRPHGLPTGARAQRLQRTGVMHRRDGRPARDPTAGRSPSAGGAGGAPQPAGPHQAPASPAAVHPRRCRCRARATEGSPVSDALRSSGWSDSTVSHCGPHPGLREHRAEPRRQEAHTGGVLW